MHTETPEGSSNAENKGHHKEAIDAGEEISSELAAEESCETLIPESASQENP